MLNKLSSFFKTMILNSFRNKIDYSTWVFSSSFNKKFNYNSKYLFEYVLEHEKDITPLFVINDDDLRKKLQDQYGEKYFIESKSIRGIKRVLSSGVWFTSAGLPVYGLNLNKKRLIVNLWHGVPLKKIALMENNFNRASKIYFKNIFSNNYSYVVTTSNNLVDIMKESFNVDEDKVKVWGQPRNDAIFVKKDSQKVLSTLFGTLPPYKKLLMYAPTFREEETILFPFDDFNIRDFNIFLEENNLLIFIRYHQFESKNSNQIYGERIKFVNSDKVEEIMDIINIFDLLITDYSSIYIDYLLTERPVMFLPYDKDKYLKDRGFNFNYDEVTPGPKPVTYIEFKEQLRKLLDNNDYYYGSRKAVNNFFNHPINKTSSYTICKKIKKEIDEKFDSRSTDK